MSDGRSVLIVSGRGLKKTDCNIDHSVCGSSINSVFAVVISPTDVLQDIEVYSSDTDSAHLLFSASSVNDDIMVCYGINPNAPFDSVDCSKHSYP